MVKDIYEVYNELYELKDKKAKILQLVIDNYNSYLYLLVHDIIYKFSLKFIINHDIFSKLDKKLIIEQVDNIDNFPNTAKIFMPKNKSSNMYFIKGKNVSSNEYYFDSLNFIDAETPIICLDSVCIIGNESDPKYYGFYYDLKKFNKV